MRADTSKIQFSAEVCRADLSLLGVLSMPFLMQLWLRCSLASADLGFDLCWHSLLNGDPEVMFLRLFTNSEDLPLLTGCLFLF